MTSPAVSERPVSVGPAPWFWRVVTGCIMALTIAAVMRLRWIGLPSGGSDSSPAVFDTWAARFCYPGICKTPADLITITTPLALVAAAFFALRALRRSASSE